MLYNALYICVPQVWIIIITVVVVLITTSKEKYYTAFSSVLFEHVSTLLCLSAIVLSFQCGVIKKTEASITRILYGIINLIPGKLNRIR